MGISTGGSIAQYFAIDHPELICHLILVSSGYRLSDTGKYLQRKLIDLALQVKWRAMASCLAGGVFSGAMKPLFQLIFWLFGRVIFGSPATPSDGLIDLEVEDRHNFKDYLEGIKAPYSCHRRQ